GYEDGVHTDPGGHPPNDIDVTPGFKIDNVVVPLKKEIGELKSIIDEPSAGEYPLSHKFTFKGHLENFTTLRSKMRYSWLHYSESKKKWEQIDYNFTDTNETKPFDKDASEFGVGEHRFILRFFVTVGGEPVDSEELVIKITDESADNPKVIIDSPNRNYGVDEVIDFEGHFENIPTGYKGKYKYEWWVSKNGKEPTKLISFTNKDPLTKKVSKTGKELGGKGKYKAVLKLLGVPTKGSVAQTEFEFEIGEAKIKVGIDLPEKNEFRRLPEETTPVQFSGWIRGVPRGAYEYEWRVKYSARGKWELFERGNMRPDTLTTVLFEKQVNELRQGRNYFILVVKINGKEYSSDVHSVTIIKDFPVLPPIPVSINALFKKINLPESDFSLVGQIAKVAFSGSSWAYEQWPNIPLGSITLGKLEPWIERMKQIRDLIKDDDILKRNKNAKDSEGRKVSDIIKKFSEYVDRLEEEWGKAPRIIEKVDEILTEFTGKEARGKHWYDNLEKAGMTKSEIARIKSRFKSLRFAVVLPVGWFRNQNFWAECHIWLHQKLWAGKVKNMRSGFPELFEYKTLKLKNPGPLAQLYKLLSTFTFAIGEYTFIKQMRKKLAMNNK
ncbi:hypothetical protein D6745_00185, partial [Candidatus Woesearchaeota archaeon]